MPSQSEALAAVRRAVAQMPAGRWLLAVSGGRDSMVLLDAFASQRREEIAGVASFDHGTGPAATEAVALVERTALALELRVMTGLHGGDAKDEASWREARWSFLRGWAAECRAGVVTAHTRDDQVETVLLRLLRGSGPRGLAAMRRFSGGAEAVVSVDADGLAVARPFLSLSRAAIARYAEARTLAWVEDPSNATLAFARNRVRHEILPALERHSPGFADWCWDISGRAALLRAGLAAWVDESLGPSLVEPGCVSCAAAPLQSLSDVEAAIVWPEIAARAGLAMDRRGIARVAAWAPSAKPGGSVQLSGGEVRRTGSTFVLRRLYSYR